MKFVPFFIRALSFTEVFLPISCCFTLFCFYLAPSFQEKDCPRNLIIIYLNYFNILPWYTNTRNTQKLTLFSSSSCFHVSLSIPLFLCFSFFKRPRAVSLLSSPFASSATIFSTLLVAVFDTHSCGVGLRESPSTGKKDGTFCRLFFPSPARGGNLLYNEQYIYFGPLSMGELASSTTTTTKTLLHVSVCALSLRPTGSGPHPRRLTLLYKKPRQNFSLSLTLSSSSASPYFFGPWWASPFFDSFSTPLYFRRMKAFT